MTVTATQPIITYQYAGLGDYTFPFKVFVETDIIVQYNDNEGFAHLLTYGSDYGVSLVDGVDGGTVTIYDTATTRDINAPNSLIIGRDLPLTQEVDWVNNDPLDAETLEDSFDRIVMILQEQQSYIDSVLIDAFSYKGDWRAYTYYNKFNVVTYAGNYYTAKTNFTTTDAFVEDNWNLVFDFSDLYDLVAQAAQSEANARASELNAKDSETNAKASETHAAQSEASAAVSENNAANCASEAYSSAQDSAASAAEAAAIVSSGERTDAIAQTNFTATAGQTDFTVATVVDPSALVVFMNSRKLRLTEDFTMPDNSTLRLNEGAEAGDEIDTLSFNLFVLVP